MALFGLLPQGALEAAQALPEALSAPPQHQGMFGIKGTLRDVLGGLGDAFLLQAGGNPMYRAIRQRERLGDVMGGMADNPLNTIAQIGSIDPALGQKYYDEYSQSQDRQAKLALDQRNTEFKQEGQFRDRVGGLLLRANEKTYGPILANMRERAKALGLEGALDGLPETYDQGAVSDWAMGTMAPKDQVDADYKTRSLESIDQNRKGRLELDDRRMVTDARMKAARMRMDAAKLTSNARMNAARIGEQEQRNNAINNRPSGKAGGIPRPGRGTPPGGTPAQTGGANGPYGKYVNQNGITYRWDGKTYVPFK